MRILYIYQYFSTPKGSWGTRAYEFARRWVEQGHQVTVITSVYDKSDIQPSGLVGHIKVDGIDVLAVNVRLSNKHGRLKRLWTFAVFLAMASWLAVTRKADIVIASSGPLTVGLPGLFATFLRGRPLVFEMRDIFSEGIEQMGVVSNRLLNRMIHWAEVFLCRTANLVVALSPGMAEWASRHAPKTPVVVVPNAADNELFGKAPGIEVPEGVARVIFSGTIGPANNCRLILDAAEVLNRRGNTSVIFELIGDGKERPFLEAEAEVRGLDNVVFRDLMPKTELASELVSAAVALLVLRPIPVFDTVSPNKLFDALAAGVPVVQTTQGWIKELLEEESCGLTVPADRPEELADAVLKIVEQPEVRRTMSGKARRVAQDLFDRDLLAQKMLEALERTVES